MQKFVEAHDRNFQTALEEIKSGRKKSHWMWYVFPQLKGLGVSKTAKFYAIENLEQAKEFLAHPVLGKNLREICSALLDLEEKDAGKIFGHPDDLKLCSSMTLFDLSSENHDNIFAKVLKEYFGGTKDEWTLSLI